MGLDILMSKINNAGNNYRKAFYKQAIYDERIETAKVREGYKNELENTVKEEKEFREAYGNDMNNQIVNNMLTNGLLGGGLGYGVGHLANFNNKGKAIASLVGLLSGVALGRYNNDNSIYLDYSKPISEIKKKLKKESSVDMEKKAVGILPILGWSFVTSLLGTAGHKFWSDRDKYWRGNWKSPFTPESTPYSVYISDPRTNPAMVAELKAYQASNSMTDAEMWKEMNSVDRTKVREIYTKHTASPDLKEHERKKEDIRRAERNNNSSSTSTSTDKPEKPVSTNSSLFDTLTSKPVTAIGGTGIGAYIGDAASRHFNLDDDNRRLATILSGIGGGLLGYHVGK